MNLDKSDYWPTSEWRFSLPDSFGVDPQVFLNADSYIKNKLKSVNSMIIIKNGYIIFEQYYNNHNCNTVSHVASITKCIMSSLIGIAIKEGYIKGVHQKISDFIPEIKKNKRLFKKQFIALHELLTMTSGITYTDISIINKNQDWIPYILELSADKRPGSFLYNDLNAHLLSIIITRLTDMSTLEFADRYLFSYLGINKSDSLWWEDSQGYNTGGWGLSLNARDMAKFGYLYLRNGIWDEYEIIPQDWVIQSTKEHVKLIHHNKGETGYGYFWWTSKIGNKKIYFARGSVEQYIINCPELDIVTIFKHPEGNHVINLFKFWKSYILPYIN